MFEHIITVLIAALPVFIIVFIGVGLRKSKVIDSAIDQGMTKLLLNVLMPCFILDKVIGSEVASDLPKIIYLAGIGAAIIYLSLAITFVFSPLLGMGKGEGRRSFSVGAGLQNLSLIHI